MCVCVCVWGGGGAAVNNIYKGCMDPHHCVCFGNRPVIIDKDNDYYR